MSSSGQTKLIMALADRLEFFSLNLGSSFEELLRLGNERNEFDDELGELLVSSCGIGKVVKIILNDKIIF